MADNTVVLAFPNDIQRDEFKYRKFTLNVIEPNVTASVIESIKQAYESASELADLAYNKISGDVESSTEAVKRNSSSDNPGATLLTIVLPLPNVFTDTQSHQWNTEKGILGEVGSGIYSSNLSDLSNLIPTNISKRIPEKLMKNFSKAAGFIPGSIKNYSIGSALGNISQVTGKRKFMIDPGYFQNYTGSDPREFSFSFEFVPNNEEEALNMMNIILKLKEFSSPEMGAGGISLTAPYFFDIEISNDYISGVANVRNVVLKSMTIDYGADGNMQFLPNGIPKYVKMDLNFAQRRITTANEYRSSGS